MVLKKYGVLFTFSMSLLMTTALYAPPGNDEDSLKTMSTTPLKKNTDQGSSLPSEETELTPEECNRRYLYTDTEEIPEQEIPEPTVLDIALAKASETLVFVLEFWSDPKEGSHIVADAVIRNSPKAVELMHDASHSVADTVIKQSPKVVQALADASVTAATSVKSAVSAVLQLPPVVHMQNVYSMYTLKEEEVGKGISLVLPEKDDDFTIVIDTNKPDASPTSSPTKKSEEESSETSWEIISSS